MHLNIINRKTTKPNKLFFDKMPLSEIQHLATVAIADNEHYLICIVATSEDDVDLIASNFHNLPIPASPAKRAVWTGDMASFIVLNYPTEQTETE